MENRIALVYKKDPEYARSYMRAGLIKGDVADMYTKASARLTRLEPHCADLEHQVEHYHREKIRGYEQSCKPRKRPLRVLRKAVKRIYIAPNEAFVIGFTAGVFVALAAAKVAVMMM